MKYLDVTTDSAGALDQLVSDLSQTTKSHYSGVYFPVHTRLQAHQFGLIEAMTQDACVSRNRLVNQLLEVALDSTLAALPDDVAQSLRLRAGEIIRSSLANKIGSSFEVGELK